MYLLGRLKGCKIHQFNIDNIVLAYLAQLSHVASVQLRKNIYRDQSLIYK